MIEAMACGTPVLALPGGAVAEIVHNGINGWICRNVDEMAKRLQSPLPESRGCRNFITNHFSLDRMVAEYLDIYQQLTVTPTDAALEAEWKT